MSLQYAAHGGSITPDRCNFITAYTNWDIIYFAAPVTPHSHVHRETEEVKVKVKLSLYLTKHHAMKTYWGSGGIAPCILDLGIRWG
jgi:hypothetical protein